MGVVEKLFTWLVVPRSTVTCQSLGLVGVNWKGLRGGGKKKY